MGQISESANLETAILQKPLKLAATIPLPIEETTPPVTKIYLVDIRAPFHKNNSFRLNHVVAGNLEEDFP